MTRSVLFKNAMVVATMDEMLREIPNASVLVKGNRIAAVGPASELPQVAEDAFECASHNGIAIQPLQYIATDIAVATKLNLRPAHSLNRAVYRLRLTVQLAPTDEPVDGKRVDRMMLHHPNSPNCSKPALHRLLTVLH
mgnify:CR=1 FL=1